MSTVIICLILCVIIFFAIKSMKKRTTSGCCGSGDSLKRIKVKDRNKAHYPYKPALHVSGMHCQNCTIRVENAFNQKEGYWAKVDTNKNEVTILSKTEHPTSELIDIVLAAGYQASAI